MRYFAPLVMSLIGRGPILVTEAEVDGKFGRDFPVVVDVPSVVFVADIANDHAAERGRVGVAQQKVGERVTREPSTEGKRGPRVAPDVVAATHPAELAAGANEVRPLAPTQSVDEVERVGSLGIRQEGRFAE